MIEQFRYRKHKKLTYCTAGIFRSAIDLIRQAFTEPRWNERNGTSAVLRRAGTQHLAGHLHPNIQSSSH